MPLPSGRPLIELSFVLTLHEGDAVDVTYGLGVAARVVPASG